MKLIENILLFVRTVVVKSGISLTQEIPKQTERLQKVITWNLVGYSNIKGLRSALKDLEKVTMDFMSKV